MTRQPSGAPRAKTLPAYTQVANELRAQILSGALAQGQQLPSESELATQFAVSRSTVREALRVLASRDLVVTSRGVTGGTFVTRIHPVRIQEYLETSFSLMSGADDVSVHEMLEARELIEVPAARLAASRATSEHIAALRDSISHARAGDTRYTDHRTFHHLVVEAADNQLLSVMNAPVFAVLSNHFLRPDLTAEFWDDIDSDHDEILAHIIAGDASGASEAMAHHLHRLRPAYVGASTTPAQEGTTT